MPHRAPSPVGSENELDISKSLFDSGEKSGSEDEASNQHPDRRARMQDAEGILDAESESDDAGFIAETQAASNRKASNLKGRSVKKGGGFQAMGLNANLLKAITRKGFSVPTPIQRKTIPLVLEGQDVVGMARTGSGKTAAFVVPMIEKLKTHSAQVGARALILSPSRELALQTLKVVKEFGRGTDLKCVLLVGGDALEEQFSLMAGNPDIVIATPGRFLHLKVEMGLDLSSIRYVVFDEADRLFEMGFAAQLAEILHALPPARQTLLFSATLPKSLVEFARAGLQDPNLVRLDSESKTSPDLENAFFTMKTAEKEGALLHILSDVIQIPPGQTEAAQRAKEDAAKTSKKRKRGDADGVKPNESPTEHSTIVFCSTKHHVEYLATLLRNSGFAVSHAYGSLDQTARKMQVQDFRSGLTNILVVTDVAARGIDIPVLANVINYDFPAQPKIFVHRVGRTARAGQKGWSYSLVREADAPYLLDLQLFLGKRLVLGHDAGDAANYTEDVVVGSLARDRLERNCELINKLLEEDDDLSALRSVAGKGEKLYLRTRNAASSESARRAKEVTASERWMELHPLFNDDFDNRETEREKMLARVSGFRPPETVFEIGKRGTGGDAAEVMKKRRLTIESRRHQQSAPQLKPAKPSPEPREDTLLPTEDVRCADGARASKVKDDFDADMSSASDSELQIAVADTSGPIVKNDPTFQDPDFFMSYQPTTQNLAEDRAYSVHASNNNEFLSAARSLTMDLGNDDGGTRGKSFAEPSRMRWDKKNKKYVARANDEDGSKGGKNLIRGESGQKIAASFRSGRFDAWRKSNKISKLPRIGEAEKPVAGLGGLGGRRYKHKQDRAPKEADKFRDDFHKRKKMIDAAKEKRLGRFKEGMGKNEIRGTEEVRKERGKKEKRKEKNARPAKRSKR
ncbi:ATP-dependent RNA helicase dbp10 [Physcia stellaris]|nr:ATP-dependent RNA helicase dbp10 [Physcia stellaris]